MMLHAPDLTAQGPPITADKPIMLGPKTIVAKTLTEVRKTELGNYVKAPVMLHYVFHRNFLAAVHVPLVNFDELGEKGTSLGDIQLMGKYQFYRRDRTAKTLRMVAKTVQTLPTGKDLIEDPISSGKYQSLLSWVMGYETIKYGISHELGYNLMVNGEDEFKHKFGFGLPLLKPTYPVNQLNLYFEYASTWFVDSNDFRMLYAQGIQYAKKRLTFEMAVQVPLVQKSDFRPDMKYNLLFGMRYIY